MPEKPVPSLDRLRVFTNRGTVAYPLAAKWTDQVQATDKTEMADEGPAHDVNEVSGKTLETYEYNQEVSQELRERLGGVLFAADSKSGSAWCYFRAVTDRPIQLTAEVFADDAASAIDQLPGLIDRYVTEVRGGETVEQSSSVPGIEADVQAFEAVADRLEIEIPWDDRILSTIVSSEPVDIIAPSTADAVGLATHLATNDAFPPLQAVVTKGSRTDSMENVDVVIKPGHVHEFTIADERRIYAAQQAIASEWIQRFVTPGIEKVTSSFKSPGLESQISRDLEQATEPLSIVVQPRKVANLKLCIAVLCGACLGLLTATALIAPTLSWAAVRASIARAFPYGSLVGATVPLLPVAGVVAVGALLITSVAYWRGDDVKGLCSLRPGLFVSYTKAEIWLGITTCGLLVVTLGIGVGLWLLA